MPDEQITILTSTDVLSEGQNLQDCGVTINYDLTWNPVRLVQRNGRIDRIGSPHPDMMQRERSVGKCWSPPISVE